MKNILQKYNQKRDKKIHHKHIYHSALKYNSEKRVGRKVGANKRKQYQNTGNENLFVVIMYLIEVFKMRLLSEQEVLNHQKKQFDFQMTGQVLKI